MIEEDKVTLTRQRAELVESLATPLSVEDRVRIQGELSIVNAKIKALNTTAAAQLKAEADRRKVQGLAEAQANAARARSSTAHRDRPIVPSVPRVADPAWLHEPPKYEQHHYRDDLACPACGTDSSAGCIANGTASDDDPAQSAAIDAWIFAVLQRGGVKVRRARDGALNLFDAPAKWVAIFDALSAGIRAAARGEELPEITAEPKVKTKTKKR